MGIRSFAEELDGPLLDAHENLSERRSPPHFVEGPFLVEHEPGADDLEMWLRANSEHRQLGSVAVGEMDAVACRNLRRHHLAERRHTAAVGAVACRQR